MQHTHRRRTCPATFAWHWCAAVHRAHVRPHLLDAAHRCVAAPNYRNFMHGRMHLHATHKLNSGADKVSSCARNRNRVHNNRGGGEGEGRQVSHTNTTCEHSSHTHTNTHIPAHINQYVGRLANIRTHQ